MFFSSPSADLRIMIYLLVFVLVLSIVVYFMTKKVLAAVFLMSVLSNLVLFLNAGSEIFDIYKIKWVVVFTLDIWPYVNLFLLIMLISIYLKNKYDKNDKK